MNNFERDGLVIKTLCFAYWILSQMNNEINLQWVLPCKSLSRALDFYSSQLGFRIDSIYPADSPRVAEMSGLGTRLRLEQGDEPAPDRLRLISDSAQVNEPLVSPDGTRIEYVPLNPELALPPLQPQFVFHRKEDEASAWGNGRAGMQYRDLIPGQARGEVLASNADQRPRRTTRWLDAIDHRRRRWLGHAELRPLDISRARSHDDLAALELVSDADRQAIR